MILSALFRRKPRAPSPEETALLQVQLQIAANVRHVEERITRVLDRLDKLNPTPPVPK